MYSANLAKAGEIRMEAPDDATHDYKFYIARVWDVGMDTANESDRLLLIRGLLKDACPSPTIVSETFLKTATGPLGGERGTYVSKVKCGKALASTD